MRARLLTTGSHHFSWTGLHQYLALVGSALHTWWDSFCLGSTAQGLVVLVPGAPSAGFLPLHHHLPPQTMTAPELKLDLKERSAYRTSAGWDSPAHFHLPSPWVSATLTPPSPNNRAEWRRSHHLSGHIPSREHSDPVFGMQNCPSLQSAQTWGQMAGQWTAGQRG